MKGSPETLITLDDDSDALRFLAIDYAWMLRAGVLTRTEASWEAFQDGYRTMNDRLKRRPLTRNAA
jgi:hypothetical protein